MSDFAYQVARWAILALLVVAAFYFTGKERRARRELSRRDELPNIAEFRVKLEDVGR